ncbi:adenosine kinase [Dactylococcopsis salina]|uniref:Sugar kinase, ribokinase n=1 Tax=Dactylococcopsis salina (strain PCC 8305) TaxID=13035 RepID=K9YUS9_DACS8|nr:adenosine kinase [Dactylococcopsis salina]AFZ50252.1 sugar kinase, ribokinase [Dactylococcopsis salina PCC 8305]
MAKYNVYGIGNALLDIEFKVTPDVLTNLGIDKGVMTLIEADRQQQLINDLGDYMGKKSGGGSAANTMFAISQFGGKCFYSCKVANDAMGESYLQDLVDSGIETNLQYQEREPGITGQCLVFVTPDADRTMNTHLGISAQFSEKELVESAIEDAEYLYMEGYLVTDPTSKAAAIKAREIAQKAGNKVALSLSDLNMAKFFKQGFLEMIGEGIDLIFANETEALTMGETEDLAQACDYLKTLSKGFVITRGAKGALAYDGENLIEIAPNSVKAVDTVGAGDMFAGAFLYGVTHGMSYADAGKLASAASARLVTSYGPRLEPQEAKEILAQV